MYQSVIKRLLDIVLSFLGLVLLLPLFLLISAAIVIDDPGPIFFTQERVGCRKKNFRLHKFRSMKRSTPRDVPTHLLDHPEKYLTRVGKLLRRGSLDELPQIWDILRGKMSVVGPRPALWNQDDLVAERDRYGANDLRPGLTGLAQISGRDELEIPEKARLDGVYAEALRSGGSKAVKMDLRCFFRTFRSVATAEGMREGSAGSSPEHPQQHTKTRGDSDGA